MRLEHLVYLLEISRNNSLTSASERLFLTPQALSTAMKNFEKELGLPLMTRTNKGIELTSHGKIICDHAKEVVSSIDAINQYCKENITSTPVSGHLSIAASPITAHLYLPSIIRDVTIQYPDIQIKAAEMPSFDILNGIIKKEYDLGIANISLSFIEANHPDLFNQLTFYEICHGKLSVLCSSHSPIYEMKSISWKKACEHPMVISVCENLETFKVFDVLNANIQPQKLYNLSNMSLCLETIKNTNSVGICIDKLLNICPPEFAKTVKTVPLRENIENGIYLISSADPCQTDLIKIFLELTTSLYGKPIEIKKS